MYIKKVYLSIIFILITYPSMHLFAQNNSTTEKMDVEGHPVLRIVNGTDTIYIADLDMYTITSLQKFQDDEEYKKYLLYRRRAVKVYPYAREAIKVFREMEEETRDLSNRKRKKHIKQLQKRLEDEFEQPLKNLSRSEGQIMVKMIEKELNTPMYDLLKDLKGGFSATYWSTFSRFYGYKLKHGYTRGEDRVLDAVLDDFDISYKIDRKKYYDSKKKKSFF
jgi:hypothetical protein